MSFSLSPVGIKISPKTNLLCSKSIPVKTISASISLAILKNGKNMIGKKLFAMSPLKNKTIPVEIVSSHYVDPKGERVRS